MTDLSKCVDSARRTRCTCLLGMSQPRNHHSQACAKWSKKALSLRISWPTVTNSSELGLGTSFKFLFEVVGGTGLEPVTSAV
jgi:hypothetical protein